MLEFLYFSKVSLLHSRLGVGRINLIFCSLGISANLLQVSSVPASQIQCEIPVAPILGRDFVTSLYYFLLG